MVRLLSYWFFKVEGTNIWLSDLCGLSGLFGEWIRTLRRMDCT